MIMVPAPYLVFHKVLINLFYLILILVFHKVGAGDVSLDEDIEVRKVNIVYIPPEYFYVSSFICTCSWEAEVN